MYQFLIFFFKLIRDKINVDVLKIIKKETIINIH